MKRPLFLCGAAFIAAAAGLFYVGWFLTLSLAVLFTAGGLLFCKGGRRLVLAMVLFALLSAVNFTWRVQADVLPVAARAGESCEVRLTITGVTGEGGYSYGVGVADLRCASGEVFRRVGVRVRHYGDTSVAPGDSYAFTGEMAPVGVHLGTIRSHMAEGRYLQVTLPAGAERLEVPAHRRDAALARLRTRVGDAASALGGDAGALLRALLTGDRSGLSGHSYEALRTSGLSHIVAVSGLHITFAANLMVGLWGHRRRGVGYLLGAVMAFGYAALAGFSPSAVRAALMFGVFALAEVAGRRADGLTSLAVAGVVIVALRPFAVGSLSFQLSFLATLGILTLAPVIKTRLEDAATVHLGSVGALRAPIASVAMSVGALVTTAPLTAAVIGFLPTCTVLANLLVVALLPYLLVLGVIGTVACLLSPALAAVLLPANLLAELLLSFARGVAKLPLSSLRITERYQWFLVCGWALLAAAACLGKLDGRHIRYALCLGVIVTCLTHSVYCYIARDEIELITFETVEAAVLRRGDRAAVIDLPDSAYGVAQVADALDFLGVTEVSFARTANPQALRLLGERIPVALAQADLARAPMGVMQIVETGDGRVEAMGIAIEFVGDATYVYFEDECLLRSEAGYAIMGDRSGGLHTGAAEVNRSILRG